MSARRLLIVLGLALVFASRLEAQISVQLEIPRRLYILYEPIIATVNITNRTGQDIILRDTQSQPWFGFQIVRDDDRPVPPLNPDYHLEPLAMGAGETVKRKINLTTLYAMGEYGAHNVNATVYYAPMEKYFSSPKDSVEITDGSTIWEQTVGAPSESAGDGGGYRTMTLLTHRMLSQTMLYYRIVDKDGGVVLATQPLGRLVMGQSPQVMLDAGNRLHVLQLIAPKTYLYSRITPSGQLLGQDGVLAVKERPVLRRVEGGGVAVKGGVVETPVAAAAEPGASPGSSRPKLSERPPGMPK